MNKLENEETGMKTLSTVLNIDKLRIPGHSLDKFVSRSGMSLVEAADQLRGRLATAIRITKHSKIQFNPNGGLFFQDASDEDTIYVIKPGDKRGAYYLATVLRPIRSSIIK